MLEHYYGRYRHEPLLAMLLVAGAMEDELLRVRSDKQFVPAPLLPPIRFNWSILLAASVEWIPVTVTQDFPDLNEQQLDTRESLVFAKGSNFTLHLWTYEGLCSGERLAGRYEWYFPVMHICVSQFWGQKQRKSAPWLHHCSCLDRHFQTQPSFIPICWGMSHKDFP